MKPLAEYMITWRGADEHSHTETYPTFHDACKRWFELKSDEDKSVWLVSELRFWRLIV
jgi:hypothetical protein